jgi:hypothetical protein
MLLKMTTMVEIETINSREMVRLPTAYEREVFAHGGRFYAPTDWKLDTWASFHFDDGSQEYGSHITTPGIHVLNEVIERSHHAHNGFWPTGLANRAILEPKRYVRETFRWYFDRATNLHELRAPEMLEADSVQRWRQIAQTFADNVKMVDGELFVRRHEPLLMASSKGISIQHTGMYDQFVDQRVFKYNQLLIREAGHIVGNAFALRDFDEAIEFAIKECGWQPDGSSEIVAPLAYTGLECMDTETIFVRETERIASNLLTGWAALRKHLSAQRTENGGTIPDMIISRLDYRTHEQDLKTGLVKLYKHEMTAENVVDLAHRLQGFALGLAEYSMRQLPAEFSISSEALRLHMIRMADAPINMQNTQPKP